MREIRWRQFLQQRFKNGAPVQQPTPTDWAHEPNDLAKKDVYQKSNIPAHVAPAGQCATGISNVNVTQQYLDGNVADVEQQLMRQEFACRTSLIKSVQAAAVLQMWMAPIVEAARKIGARRRARSNGNSTAHG